MTIKPRPEPPEPFELPPTVGQIIGGWLRDESFYRDIVTRSLSIVITAVLGYLAARALGYLGPPPRSATPVIGLAVFTTAVGIAFFLLADRGKRVWAYIVLIVSLAAMLLIIEWQEPLFDTGLTSSGRAGWFYGPLTLAWVIPPLILLMVRALRPRRRNSAAAGRR